MSHEQSGRQFIKQCGLEESRDHAVPWVSTMLRFFHEGVRNYQPEGLARETGDPRIPLDNINRLRQTGLVISQIFVRPTVRFSYSVQASSITLRLSRGGDGRETEILSRTGSRLWLGRSQELLDCYHAIPSDFEGPLPDLLSNGSEDVRGCLSRLNTERVAAFPAANATETIPANRHLNDTDGAKPVRLLPIRNWNASSGTCNSVLLCSAAESPAPITLADDLRTDRRARRF